MKRNKHKERQSTRRLCRACGLPFCLLWKISPFCLGGVLSTITARGGGVAHIPRRAGVNGLLCPRFLLGCVRLSPSCVCWMLASPSMCCTRWLLCPVYRIAGKCDRIATTLERKQKQSMTIKQENNVSSILYSSAESTKTHGFHALGAGDREFESRHSDMKKTNDITFSSKHLSWVLLFDFWVKSGRLCVICSKSRFQRSLVWVNRSRQCIIPRPKNVL